MDVPSDTSDTNKRKRSFSSSSEDDEYTDSEISSLSSEETSAEESTSDSEAATPTNEIRKSPCVRQEFLTYRRMEAPSDFTKFDYFSILPDEVILKIFSYLNYKNLTNVALVCKRMRQIVIDESLWPRLDVSKRHLKPGAVDTILSRGVRILRMYSTNFISPVFPTNENYFSKVEYLDLSQATISIQDLNLLLKKQRNLKKVSLDTLDVDNTTLKEISKNKNLDTLNLNMCTGICADGIKALTKGCRMLSSLNVAWTKLDENTITELVNRIGPEITEINLSGHCETLKDKHIIKLASRCPKLTSLDFSDCVDVTEASLLAVVENLFRLEVLSLSRCYKISPLYLLELRSLPNLKKINAFLLLVSSNKKAIEQVMPKVLLNSEFSTPIARPCVNYRRNTIWKIKVRD